jgi:hypothetical protein
MAAKKEALNYSAFPEAQGRAAIFNVCKEDENGGKRKWHFRFPC